VCLQIGGNCARSPTNYTSFVSNGDVFAIDIAYFKHCSTTQNMLLVIMDISSIMTTFVIFSFFMTLLSSCRNPTLAKCGGEAQHSQSWGFGVLRDSRMFRVRQQGQNTSHWGVLCVIGKVLKRRYRKWPRIGHLDICSPSYEQKKGWKSNWQFDSRPLKVRNRPLPDVRIKSATRSWKDLDEGCNFG